MSRERGRHSWHSRRRHPGEFFGPYYTCSRCTLKATPSVSPPAPRADGFKAYRHSVQSSVHEACTATSRRTPLALSRCRSHAGMDHSSVLVFHSPRGTSLSAPEIRSRLSVSFLPTRELPSLRTACLSGCLIILRYERVLCGIVSCQGPAGWAGDGVNSA